MLPNVSRKLLRKLHLTIGLWFGIIFVVLGVTGSALPWMHELDGILNPDMLHVVPGKGLRADDPAALTPSRLQDIYLRLAGDPRYGPPSMITLPGRAGEALVAWYRPLPGAARGPWALEVSRQVMINPYTLGVTGERYWGELGLTRPLFMPTLFHLHRYLAAGAIGKTLIGISGLMLLIVAIAGMGLWLPRANWKALNQALHVSFRGSWARLNYSSHRAAGFFAAPVLVVMGFSGCYFNLPNWVLPIVSAIATVTPAERLSNHAPHAAATITLDSALRHAQARFPDARLTRVALPSTAETPYEVRMRQADEGRHGDGATRITVDAYSGNILRVRDPLRAPPGDTMLNWLFPLHSGIAFGMGGRIFISILGIVPLFFFVTGVTIWLRRKLK